MDKKEQTLYRMTDEDLKVLKKSIEYVRKLDIFGKNKEFENKSKRIKKVA
ncbi:MAG TPA: hypothetical protein OIM48_04600 [Clostridiaceae bacterium]|nr:hypothetical protein [Clostridiaceae bacterium]